MLRARAWEWDKDPLFARGDRGVEKSLIISNSN
jgi:hypothetical protein